jgi:hypothetical protein
MLEPRSTLSIIAILLRRRVGALLPRAVAAAAAAAGDRARNIWPAGFFGLGALPQHQLPDVLCRV